MVNILFPMVTIITKDILNNYILQKKKRSSKRYAREGGGGGVGGVPI